MDDARLEDLLATYRDGLLDDVLPFWERHAVDREHGGFTFCLDRDGSVLDTDKGIWQHGRFVWLLSTLAATVGRAHPRRDEWIELARHGIEFLRAHAFDPDDDGRMFFQVTRDGRPLRKRRYVFTESFGCIAFAAWARVSGDDAAADTARRLFRTYLEYGTTPGRIPPKVDPRTRPQRGLGFPMIALVTAQVMRAALDDPEAGRWIDWALDEIRVFVREDLEAVLETVGAEGEVLDHFDGRTLNPGHAIEAAWFVLEEARIRGGAPELVRLGTRMLDWTWARGWDGEYGGILYFVDLFGRPVQEYWHDMKFWWPHNEAVLATLMAWRATGDARYLRMHREVHDWAYRHFPDPIHGEWYGYLHRDGRVSVPLKGNLWKGPFHLPRMQMLCWELLDGVRGERRRAGE